MRDRVAGGFLRYTLRQQPSDTDEVAGQTRRPERSVRYTVLSVIRREFTKMSTRGKSTAITVLTLSHIEETCRPSHARPFSVQRWSSAGFAVQPRARQVCLVVYICSAIRQILASSYEQEKARSQHQCLHRMKGEKVDTKGFSFPELHGLDWPGRRVILARTNCQPQIWPTGLLVGV